MFKWLKKVDSRHSRSGRRAARRSATPLRLEQLEQRNLLSISSNLLDQDAGLGLVIAQQAAAGEIQGTLWNDADANGMQDPGEAGLSNWTVYLDLDQNGQQDGGDPTQTTDAAGNYMFTGLAPGAYYVGVTPPAGWNQTYPAASDEKILFQTGFEAAEGYSLGSIFGQQGWTGGVGSNVEPVVSNANPSSGTQHLLFGEEPENEELFLEAYTPAFGAQADGRYTVSVDVAIDDLGGDYRVVVLGAGGEIVAAVNFSGGGSLEIYDDPDEDGFYDFTDIDREWDWIGNAYHTLTVDIDAAANRIDYFYDASNVYSTELVGPGGVEQVLLQGESFTFGTTGAFDNLQVVRTEAALANLQVALVRGDEGAENIDFGFQSTGVVPTVEFTAAGQTAAESAGGLTVTAALSEAASQTVTVDFSLSGTATLGGGADYTTSPSGTITIPAGQMTGTATINVNDDNIVEPGETIILTMTAATGANLGAETVHTATITDNDTTTLTLAAVPGSALEGDSGSTDFTYSVTLSNPVQGGLSVAYATQDGTATAGDDYTAGSGMVTFAGNAGEVQTFTVAVLGDTDVEGNETFDVLLGAVSGLAAGIDPASVATAGTPLTSAIHDDDQPALVISDAALTEGDSGTKTATFTVTLTLAVAGGLTVDYATADGTAAAGSDYTAAGGTLTFAGTAGEQQTISVEILGDTVVELDETFTVLLDNVSDPGVVLGDPEATGAITNDDTASLAINDVVITEGDSGTQTATFTMTLSGAVDTGLAVDYATSDGTASAGSDYTAASGTLNFSGTAGETRTVSVTVAGDETVELDETFSVLLSNLAASGRAVTLADATGTGTIVNDDAASISIGDVTLVEGSSGTSTATFTVTLDSAVQGGFTVDFATVDGTAVAASDYTATSGMLTFTGTAGETQTISVPVIADERVELDETFSVLLSNLNAGGKSVTIADGTGVATIGDDDTATLVIGDVTITEGNSGTKTATFTVTLDRAVDAGVSVDYATASGTATAGVDYAAASDTLIFVGTAGETRTISVQVNGDVTVELDETLTVVLSNADAEGRSVTISDAEATGTIVNDDAASLSIDDVTVVEGNSGTAIALFTVTLNNAVDVPLSVSFATADGTALAGSDYTAADGTLNFSGTAGETQTVAVEVLGDETPEQDETFFVNLSGLSAAGRNVTIADAQGAGTIASDDGGLPVDIAGTPRADTVKIQPRGDEVVVILNGRIQRYSAAEFSIFNFDGRGGNDKVFFYDSPGDDTFYGEAATKSGRLVLSTGMEFSATDAERIYVIGSKNASLHDRAFFTGTAGADAFSASSTSVTFKGSGYYYQVTSFGEHSADVSAQGSGSSKDQALLYGSTGSDMLIGDGAANSATLTLATKLVFQAIGFDSVTAQARKGFRDQAFFTGSPGGDAFYGRDDESTLKGPGYKFSAEDFDLVEVDVSADGGQGVDTANFDGDDDDSFVGDAAANIGRLVYESRAENRVIGFDKVFTEEVGRVTLSDTPGRDTFYGRDDDAYLTNDVASFYFYFNEPERVTLNSTGGEQNVRNIRSLDFVFKTTGSWLV